MESWRQGASGTAIGWLLDAAVDPKTGSQGDLGSVHRGSEGSPKGHASGALFAKLKAKCCHPWRSLWGTVRGTKIGALTWEVSIFWPRDEGAYGRATRAVEAIRCLWGLPPGDPPRGSPFIYIYI